MKFKSPDLEERFEQVEDVLKLIIYDISNYVKAHFKEDVVITSARSTEEEDKVLKRTSKTHFSGRAVDLRRTNITDMQVVELLQVFNVKYSSVAAFNREGAVRLIVPKTDHLHVQIKELTDEQKRNFFEEARS